MTKISRALISISHHGSSASSGSTEPSGAQRDVGAPPDQRWSCTALISAPLLRCPAGSTRTPIGDRSDARAGRWWRCRRYAPAARRTSSTIAVTATGRVIEPAGPRTATGSPSATPSAAAARRGQPDHVGFGGAGQVRLAVHRPAAVQVHPPGRQPVAGTGRRAVGYRRRVAWPTRHRRRHRRHPRPGAPGPAAQPGDLGGRGGRGLGVQVDVHLDPEGVQDPGLVQGARARAARRRTAGAGPPSSRRRRTSPPPRPPGTPRRPVR